MKETVRSLRIDFIFSGLASLCFEIPALAVALRAAISRVPIFAAAIGIVNVASALAVC